MEYGTLSCSDSSVSYASGCRTKDWSSISPLCLLGEEPACAALGKLHRLSPGEGNSEPRLSILYLEILEKVTIGQN